MNERLSLYCVSLLLSALLTSCTKSQQSSVQDQTASTDMVTSTLTSTATTNTHHLTDNTSGSVINAVNTSEQTSIEATIGEQSTSEHDSSHNTTDITAITTTPSVKTSTDVGNSSQHNSNSGDNPLPADDADTNAQLPAQLQSLQDTLAMLAQHDKKLQAFVLLVQQQHQQINSDSTLPVLTSAQQLTEQHWQQIQQAYSAMLSLQSDAEANATELMHMTEVSNLIEQMEHQLQHASEAVNASNQLVQQIHQWLQQAKETQSSQTTQTSQTSQSTDNLSTQITTDSQMGTDTVTDHDNSDSMTLTVTDTEPDVIPMTAKQQAELYASTIEQAKETTIILANSLVQQRMQALQLTDVVAIEVVIDQFETSQQQIYQLYNQAKMDLFWLNDLSNKQANQQDIINSLQQAKQAFQSIQQAYTHINQDLQKIKQHRQQLSSQQQTVTTTDQNLTTDKFRSTGLYTRMVKA